MPLLPWIRKAVYGPPQNNNLFVSWFFAFFSPLPIVDNNPSSTRVISDNDSLTAWGLHLISLLPLMYCTFSVLWVHFSILDLNPWANPILVRNSFPTPVSYRILSFYSLGLTFYTEIFNLFGDIFFLYVLDTCLLSFFCQWIFSFSVQQLLNMLSFFSCVFWVSMWFLLIEIYIA